MKIIFSLLVTVLLGAESFVERQGNVQGMFAKAQELYRLKRFSDAMVIYDKIVRDYPQFQPAIIQYAKVLMRLDRLGEAHALFRRVNPVGLDTETLYQYGLAHFFMRQYGNAFHAFYRIPPGHPLADLANYYGGISALKIGRLVDAENMLERATVLPDKLRRSRINYQRHIERLLLIYEKMDLEKKRKELARNLGSTPLVDGATTERLAKREEYFGFENVEERAQVGFKYQIQDISRHGFVEERARLRTTYGEILAVPYVGLPLWDRNRQAALGLKLTLRGEERLREGRVFFNLQNQALDEITQKETSDRVIQKIGSIKIRPWIEVPFRPLMWAGAGGEIGWDYPDFGTADRTGFRHYFLRLGSKDSDFAVEGLYQYEERLDQSNKLLVDAHRAQINGNYVFSEIFESNLRLVHRAFNYGELEVNGPEQVSRVEAEFVTTLPLGFSVWLLGAYENQNSLTTFDTPTADEITASGHIGLAKLSLQLDVGDYFRLSVAEEIQKAKWTVANTEFREEFERNVADQQQQFEILAQLNLLL